MWYAAQDNTPFKTAMIMKCPYCGSSRIETGIAWGMSVNTGDVGLRYDSGFMGEGVAQVYSDLCLDCKSILRMYIKEGTDKNWIHKPEDGG